ncbi:MAG: EAL domain-containing protein [Granulosicoccus sp.]|nr:EAL domain-containing protein [Granulosicoccus sp.]
MASSIIALAGNLNLTVIAEGVETEDQLDWLREHNCDQAQGYLFSKQLPFKAFMELIERHRNSQWTPSRFAA